MKKILIVNNNMKVGGVQKALYNLLWEIEGKYEVTLCLFNKCGEYVDMLPPSVKVIEAKKPYAYLGISQGECSGFGALVRGGYAFAARLIGRKKILSFMNRIQPRLDGSYDCAISYLHNGREKSFYGGTQDFVLGCVKAERKVAFIHGDYRNCGADHPANNRDMERFDVVVACSDGCRNAILSVVPSLEDKCVTVQNCHRFDEIRAMAEENPIEYSENHINLLIVARLSHEKGIERAITALAEAVRAGSSAKLHIVGGGTMRRELSELAASLGVSDDVVFYGEQKNPYRYMKNADVLLISSYHEAAPMVIDEARCLGVPVLTTETTSSYDMVTARGCGWVCENSQSALNEMLAGVVSDKNLISDAKERLRVCPIDNGRALAQFDRLIQ